MVAHDEADAAMLRQGVHDAVRALLTAPPHVVEGSNARHKAATRLATRPGAVALTNLAEELAADLAESFGALAVAQGQRTLAVLGSPCPAHIADHDEGLDPAVRQELGSGMART